MEEEVSDMTADDKKIIDPLEATVADIMTGTINLVNSDRVGRKLLAPTLTISSLLITSSHRLIPLSRLLPQRSIKTRS